MFSGNHGNPIIIKIMVQTIGGTHMPKKRKKKKPVRSKQRAHQANKDQHLILLEYTVLSGTFAVSRVRSYEF
jgi:hypothetical protein